jgi:LuxR family transcriptional regulator, maltose regulon positive regulatory protein
VLRAPAGYGKTTLLEAWSRVDPRPFHWLVPGRGPLAAARWSPCVIVVDGWSGPPDVAQLLDALPEGSLLVVASRGATALPMGRLRAQGDVLELGAAELALTPREAQALMVRAGVRLSGAALDAFMGRCEGWPAAVALAAQAVRGDPDPDRTAAEFGGRDPFVADYVRDELLAPLAPDQRRFLRRCSVLDVLDAEVCDAVLGRADSAAVLDGFERAGLPVARLRRGRPQLRCHPLLREVLRAELERDEPGREPVLHRRASVWFDRRDDLDGAVAHALAAVDLARAGELVWSGAAGYPWDGRRAVLERWLRGVPACELRRHPALALTLAMAELSRFALPQVAHWLTHVDPDVAAAPEGMRRSLRAGRAALEAVLTSGGVTQLRAGAAQAAALAADGEVAMTLAALVDGVAATLAGDAARATDVLERAIRQAAVSAPGLAALGEAQLALAALCAADWEGGAALAERARSRAAAVGLGGHPSLALAIAVAAFARAHRGRFAEARVDAALATRLLSGCEGLPPWYGAQAGLALARAQLRLSDAGAADAGLAEARRALRRMPDAPALSAWVADATAIAQAAAPAELGVAQSLTTAELRVVRFLPSHLSFREIGVGLHVSANTIKSQAHAIYRKLGVSSRSAAVERAGELGLLDAPAPSRVH